jgi:hypothetical protein
MGSSIYGLRIYRYGVELKGDGRRRETLPGGHVVIVRPRGRSLYRGKIRAWSESSAKRLAFIAANVELLFSSHVTLTYHALQAAWETCGDRSRRFVARCKQDLHRFLRALRTELGEYLWVREFQERGVVHYHVLAEKELAEARASEAWARASGQFADEAVLRHGVKVDGIKSQSGARRYLGQYIGKEKQKELPAGVDGAGRWWGRSRGLKLAMLEEIVWLDRADLFRRRAQLRIVRVLRRYIEKRMQRRYRGGAFLDFGGKLSATLAEMAGRLRGYYGWDSGLEERLELNGWELFQEGATGGDDGKLAGCNPEVGRADAGGEVGEEAGGDERGTKQTELWPAG